MVRSIREEYCIRYGDVRIGTYYVFEDGGSRYEAYRGWPQLESIQAELKALGLADHHTRKTQLPRFRAILNKGERAPGTRKLILRDGLLSMERIPKDAEKFWVYRRSANKGNADYSPKAHSAPHREGSRVVEGMEEWASWYAFNKKDDGTFEAELDEAWDEGSHYGGGTIRAEVPEAWLDLPWEEFLERLVTLAAAAHYGFTPEDLEARRGLKAFFGFE
jgi:hypothetical protein